MRMLLKVSLAIESPKLQLHRSVQNIRGDNMKHLYIARNENENFTALVLAENGSKAENLLRDYSHECDMDPTGWELTKTCITDIEDKIFDCDHLLYELNYKANISVETVKDYLFKSEWNTEIFIATEGYGDDSTNIAMVVEIADGVDFEKSAMLASTEYCLTEEGREVYENNCECFNWGDFDLNVPNKICEKYGIRKIKSDVSAELDYNQQLVDRSKIFSEE